MLLLLTTSVAIAAFPSMHGGCPRNDDAVRAPIPLINLDIESGSLAVAFVRSSASTPRPFSFLLLTYAYPRTRNVLLKQADAPLAVEHVFVFRVLLPPAPSPSFSSLTRIHGPCSSTERVN